MINIVKKYLDECKFSNKKENFEDLFLSHPNYPSVFAITDSLDMLSIENIAIKIPKEQFDELPESFLAMFNDAMVLVSKSTTSVTVETEVGKRQKLTFNEFLSSWNEVVLAIEPNTNPILNTKKTNLKWLLYILPITLLIVLSVTYNKYSLNSSLLLITSLIGLLISVFIVQEKLGIKNEMVSKFCNINPNTSCQTVIQSNKSDFNQWVGFSDLPLLFFSMSFLAIIIQPESSSNIVGHMSLLSIPIVGYSIWLQKMKLKKWCVLCLGVSGVMVIQSLIFGVVNFISFQYKYNKMGLVFSFLVSCFPLSGCLLNLFSNQK